MPPVESPRPRRRSAKLALAALALIPVTLLASVQLIAQPAAAKSGRTCAYAQTGPKHLSHAQARDAVRCLINKRRAHHGAGPLAANAELQWAAQKHSRHMLRRGCFSHDCPGEASMTGRIRKSGYLGGVPTWGVAENIAAGLGRHGSPARIVQSWMRSSSHRAAMLSGQYEHIGVGMAGGTPSHPRGGGGTYTADFGFSRSAK